MPRFDPILTNFSSGELSPLMEGRIDLEGYQSSAKIVENFRTTPHGPVIRRGGSRYVAKAKLDSSFQVRLIPFTADLEGQFVLEFGDNYIRFYTEHGQLVRDAANPPEGEPYEIATTYAHTDLFELDFKQDRNTLYLAHKDYPTATLVRNDTYDWVLSDISFTGKPAEWVAGNYPGVVGFHEQRLFLAATKDQSQTFWASKIGEPYTDFTIGTNDDDAFKYTIATDKDSRIVWFSSGDFLMAGTTGGEFKIGSTDFKAAITPTNVKATRQTNYGAAFIRPIRIGTEVVFVQKGRLKVRNLEYSLERDKYAANDLTFLSEHITSGGIVDSDYQNEPDSIAWYVLSKGDLIGLSYEPELGITGWFRYTMSNALIKSVAVIDGFFDISYDEVWVVVDRVVNSQPVRYIEILEPSLKRTQNIEDSFYVDSGLSIPSNQLPATVITNLDHLEGEEVHLLVDGWVHPPQTVVSGSITLNTEATKAVHAGLPFTSTLRTLRLEGGNPIGTAQGKTKRIKKMQIRLDRSLGLKVGDEKLDWDFFGPPTMNQSNELFTGDREVDIDDGYSKDAEVNIVQDQPLPTTIVCVMPEARTE